MLNKYLFSTLLISSLLGLLSPSILLAEEQNTEKEVIINQKLDILLKAAGFTGTIETTLRQRLGRNLNRHRVNLGKNLFFDSILGLRGDNSCAGCHSPLHGFGDSQSIAIGIQNNNKVGPDRKGPRNQRRTPTLLNVAFFPKLMWNGRFSATSGDPFDNSLGFSFPMPEGQTKFLPNDPSIKHLLVAQAHIPPTELVEMAGLKVTQGSIDPRFKVFDDGKGAKVPDPDQSGFRNDNIRQKVLDIINKNNPYRRLFEDAYPNQGIKAGGKIEYKHIAQALAEFQFSLTRANAPIDRYARGQKQAMSISQKRGALLFFGEAGCVNCHSVAGKSFEMFSDFENHRIAVPQIAPAFGKKTGNVIFDGPDANQDFGAEQISGERSDRYKFRTSPLRNVALQPSFFHNGAFTKLEDAVKHHLDVISSAKAYSPKRAGVAKDLKLAPVDPLLEDLDPLISTPLTLDKQEFLDLVEFLKISLLDPKANPKNLCKMIPDKLPSRRKLPEFQGCLK